MKRALDFFFRWFVIDRRLQVLRLDTNALRYIPNDIGTISTLKELTIHDNPLPQDLLELADLDSVMVCDVCYLSSIS